MENMNNSTLIIGGIITIILITLLSCNKEILHEDNEVQYIYKSLTDKGIYDISHSRINELLESNSNNPCRWDFNGNGNVGSEDLGELLEGYGTLFTVLDLNSFLTAYGTNYIVDVIPFWNNYIQDVNCALDWDVLHKIRCDGNISSLDLDLIETEWVREGEIVGTNPYKMDWKTYGPINDPLSCNTPDSYQPPCNGLHEITCRIFFNGNVYERTNIGFAQINIPDSLNIEICSGLSYELMDYNFNSYNDLEFLIP